MLAARAALEAALGRGAWGGAGGYALSGAAVAVVLLPVCACMGASFPLALAAARRFARAAPREPFSALYFANVLGAAAGAAAAALVLIEWLGLRGTLGFAASLETAVAAAAIVLSFAAREERARRPAAPRAAAAASGASDLVLLFAAGLCAMGMELVWIRLYTPYVGTTIYAFAAILSFYLAASCAGTALYRAAARRGRGAEALSLALLAAGPLSLVPLSTADPATPLPGLLRAALGLVPLCAALGAITPALVDRRSGGDPDRAGAAYAANLAGCVLGPLLAGFGFLPRVGERAALVWLSLPLFAAGASAARRWRGGSGPARALAAWAAASALAAVLPAASATYEETVAAIHSNSAIRRDYQASVVAAADGERRHLIVNGQGMTSLSPITKAMAHLPAALLGRPRGALVICFGMGTTFRALVSWGIPTTAVELVPSVPGLFGRFHADAARVLAAPGAAVVVDDGRRFLARSTQSYDLITIDPPPPLDSAGTGMLYSKEFYALIRARLSPGGLVAQWIAEPLEPAVRSSFAAALRDSFPYVRVYRSFDTRDGWGYHALAGLRPIPTASARELARRLPPAAAADFVEFGPEKTAEAQFRVLLSREVPLEALTGAAAPALTDDRPINEYYVLRRTFPSLAARLLGR